MRSSSHLGAWSIVVLAVGSACAADVPVLYSPAVAQVDALSPSTDFARPGSLFLGDGWGRPEGDGRHPDWGAMAWAVGREAVLHVLTVRGEKVDLYARALPYPWAPGSPSQGVEVVVGDRAIGPFEMRGAWTDIRVSLPDDFSTGSLREIRLRFRHALKPRDLGTGPDNRPLAAGFTRLAVVPRHVQDPVRHLETAEWDPRSSRARLPSGGGIAIPLPPASRVRVRVTEAETACASCTLTAQLLSAGGPLRTLWSGPAEDASGLLLSFDTAPGAIDRLLLRIGGPRSTDPRAVVDFVLSQGARQRAQPRGAEHRPHVFLYLVDTLRADAVAPYSATSERTPHIAAFARESVAYEARAPSAWTLPSVVSLLTGQYAERHGVLDGSVAYDAARIPPLPRLLGQQGYRTVGLSHSYVMSAAYGLDAGFERFHFSNYLFGDSQDPAAPRSREATDLLAAWLHATGVGKPVFAYIHTVDPHAPYARPRPGRRHTTAGSRELEPHEYSPQVFAAKGYASDRQLVLQLHELYLEEVAGVDAEFGRFVGLLKSLDLYDRSLIVLTSDHGEEFAEHGGFDHGHTLFDEVLRVPLIVRYPGGRWAGARPDDPVSLVDVAPTVLSQVGISRPPGRFDGVVLAPGPAERGAAGPTRFEVVVPRKKMGRRYVSVDLQGILVDRVKCIENRGTPAGGVVGAPRLLAFDLTQDPAERRPLSPDARATRQCAPTFAWLAERRRAGTPQTAARPASEETVERLRALGYMN